MKATSSRYRTIHCKIWNDDKFPFLSTEGKLVFFLLLTTTFSTPFGAYKAGKAALEEESRMDTKGFAKGFGECLANGLAKYDETTRTVFLPNFMRHNQPANPNVVKNWARMFNELPDSDIKPEVYRAILECCEGLGKGYAEGFRESFIEPTAKGYRIQEQEQEQEQDKQPLSDSDRTTAAGAAKRAAKNDPAAEERFNAFWQAYPRKTAKQRALAVWKRKKCWNGEFDAILAGLTAHKESDQWQRDDGRYIPHPSTFLEQERWRDEIACPVHGQKIGGLTF